MIRAFNETHQNEACQLKDNVLPEPFIGDTAAQIVLLNLNPGFDDRNAGEHARSEFQSLLRTNLSQGSAGFPFYYLDPRFESEGRRWWENKLRSLLKLFGRNQLARSILCIELFPYHSRRFCHENLKLPSQEYGFGLARSAIARGAVVVIMRARRQWLAKIPELEKYPRVYTLKNPQNVVISPGNCPGEGFENIVSAIRNGGGLL
jgi:hypothetical protein